MLETLFWPLEEYRVVASYAHRGEDIDAPGVGVVVMWEGGRH